jgi:hypothetical protein
MGNISFGYALVTGINLVPRSAAGLIALRTFISNPLLIKLKPFTN